MRKLSYILRNVFKFKGNTTTKIVSLTIGLTVGLVLFSYNAYDLSFDKFHKDGERLYRIGVREDDGMSLIVEPLANAVLTEIPEVDAATCIFNQRDVFYTFGKNRFLANTIYADTAFFNLFSYRMLSGDMEYGLSKTGQVFLSETFAAKVFGNKNPMGEQMSSEGEMWTVAGIFEDVPENTHLPFSVVKSLPTLEKTNNVGWQGREMFTGYVRLRKGVNAASVDAKFASIVSKHQPENKISYYLQPVREIHIKYNYGGGQVMVLGMLGIIVLFVSGLNYVLISVSSLSLRAKEVGIHKVNGATLQDVFNLFLGETIVLILLSTLLSFGLIFVLREQLEGMMYLSFRNLMIPEVLWTIFGVVCLLILIAGVIPARMFAKVSVMEVFRQFSTGGRRWKQTLLGVQFASVTFLLAALIIFSEQYDLMMNKDLGYDMKGVYYSQLTCAGGTSGEQVMKEELQRLNCVEAVAFSNTLPLFVEDGAVYSSEEQKKLMSTCRIKIDEDYLNLMKIPMLEGEKLREIFSAGNKVIVNNTFVKKLQQKEIVGANINVNQQEVVVGGVCRDFQVWALYNPQLPLVIEPLMASDSARALYLSVRINPVTTENLLTVRKAIRDISGLQTAGLSNYKAVFQGGYSFELTMKDTVKLISLLAIAMAILGLIGFVSDEMARRTKEIAIRKVNGASIFSVLLLLFAHVGKLLLYSLPFAVIGAYFAGQQWLASFAYRMPLAWWVFAGAAAITGGIVFITVVVKSRRGLTANPVKALKSE